MATSGDAQNGTFFGSGMYASFSSEYGCMYAMDAKNGGIAQPDEGGRTLRPKNKRGECVVLGLYGSVERAYAGTRLKDYPQHGKISTHDDPLAQSYLHSDAVANGTVTHGIQTEAIEATYLTSLESGYDTKYFIVSDELGYQAVNLLTGSPRPRDDKKAAAYNELVFKKDSQLYPFALFYFKPPH